MLFASISMTGAHAAMAMPGMSSPASSHAAMQMTTDHAKTSMPPGHCGDEGSTQKAPKGSGIDCTIACSVIPAVASGVAELPPPLAIAQPLLKEQQHDGLNPESDPPPPRHS